MSVLQAYLQGRQARQQQNQMDRQNAMQEYMGQNAQGIFAGDNQALGGLAQFDPMMALNLKGTINADKRGAAAEGRASEAHQLRVAEYIRGLSKEQAAEEKAQLEGAIQRGLATQSDEEWDALMQSDPDTQQYVGQWGNRMEVAKTLLPYVKHLEMQAGAGAAPNLSEAEQELARMGEAGITREEAIKIKEGVYRVITDPTTKESVVFDLQTQQIIRPLNSAQPEPAATVAPPPAFGGQQFEGAADSFGAGGWFKGIVNKATDATGWGAFYPSVQDAQNDFKVLRETLTSQIQNVYDGRVPAFLLQNIQDLTPDPGKFFEGPSQAQSKLTALARSLNTERESVTRQLTSRALSPTNRAELERRMSVLDASMAEIGVAISAFRTGVQLAPEVEDRLKAYE